MLNENMMQKYVMTMLKPWPHMGLLGSHLHEIIGKLGSAMEIPTGYQDETGFCFGAEPVERQVKWPDVR
jgi:hypothetical protein